MKILFTEDRLVRDQHVGTDKETKFLRDHVYDLAAPSVDRWIRRGAGTTHPDLIAAAEARTGKAELMSDAAAVPAKAEVAIPNNWRDLKPKEAIALAQELGAKDAKSGEKAYEAINAALFERAQPIVFNNRQDGKQEAVFAAKPWPQYALLSRDIDMAHVEAKDNRLTITVANGIAVYEIVAEQRAAAVGALVENTFEPAPAAQ